MNINEASKLFEGLSSPVRLAVFQALTASGDTGMIAGDLAKALDITPNNLSFHLKTLTVVGLVHSVQEGRCVRYFAHLEVMNQLQVFLSQACCRDNLSSCCPPNT